MTKAESRSFLDKHHLGFSEVQYGHFKKQIRTLEDNLTTYSE